MSHWWIQHLEPHLRVIFDGETGPMSHAKADGSFSGWPALQPNRYPRSCSMASSTIPRREISDSVRLLAVDLLRDRDTANVLQITQPRRMGQRRVHGYYPRLCGNCLNVRPCCVSKYFIILMRSPCRF